MITTLRIYINAVLFDGTEQCLHIRDVSQVLQQLMQQVVLVRRDCLQMLQKQLEYIKLEYLLCD